MQEADYAHQNFDLSGSSKPYEQPTDEQFPCVPQLSTLSRALALYSLRTPLPLLIGESCFYWPQETALRDNNINGRKFERNLPNGTSPFESLLLLGCIELSLSTIYCSSMHV